MKDLISRRKILLAGSAAAIGFAASHLTPSFAVAKPEQKKSLATIYNTEEFLVSGPAGRTFRIQISHPHPDSPHIQKDMQGLKPVPVYVIDGGYAFGLVSSITRYLQWGGEQPPCLVVGIAYEDMVAAGSSYRLHDLTPPDPDWSGWPDEVLTSESVGGGPDFRDFLLNTLKPLIESRFPVDASNSVLFGHSFGGLFALNTMLEAPGAFANILSLSPSLWFAERRILKTLQKRLEKAVKFSEKIAIYVGGREENIASESSRMTSNVEALGKIVAAQKLNFGGSDIQVLADRTHHNILGQGVTMGLEFLLSHESRKK
jgi:hypothetical protein